MPIHFKQFEKLLEKWLSFLMIPNTVNDGGSWIAYKVLQKATKVERSFAMFLLALIKEKS